MKVQLKQRQGRNLATGELQFYQSYWVILDDERVGAISWKKDSKFLPRRPIDPIAMKKITAVIEDALERTVLSKKLPPEIPQGTFDDEDEGKQYADDFADS